MIEDITERVFKRLISLRKDRGITREFLADEIGYPYYVIRRIEQLHSGNMDALLKIISFWKERVGLNVDELFFSTTFDQSSPLPEEVEEVEIDDDDIM